MPSQNQPEIKDWSGGYNGVTPFRLAPNESPSLSNVIGVEGNLQTYWGNSKIASTSGASWFGLYKPASGQGIPLYLNGNILYAMIGGSYTPYPLYQFSVTPTDLSDAQYNTRMYIASGTNPLVAWEGFYYVTGTAACDGAGNLAGTSTAWTTAGVIPGDIVFYKNGSTWTYVGIVQSITSNTAIVLSTNGANTSGAKTYIISRVRLAGITAPVNALVAAQTITPASSPVTVNAITWTASTIKASVGNNTSPILKGSAVAIDSSGNIHVAYTSGQNWYYSFFNGTTWATSSHAVGYYSNCTAHSPSIAVDSSGNIHVCLVAQGYVGSTTYYYKPAGGTWTATFAVAGVSGVVTAKVVLNASGNPYIIYQLGYKLYIYKFGGSVVTLDTGASGEARGKYFDCYIDGSNLLHCAYWAGTTTKGLKFLTWDVSAWTGAATITVVDSADVGYFASIAKDGSGYDHIAYLDSTGATLKHAFWTGAAWTKETVDNASIFSGTGIVVDSTGQTDVAYWDVTNKTLWYASKPSGGAWTTHALESATVNGSVAMAMDSSNNAYITYGHINSANTDLNLMTESMATTITTPGVSTNAGIFVQSAYQWGYTYGNSHSGYESNIVPLLVTVNCQTDTSAVVLALPSDAVAPTDMQIDTINIYRTMADGDLLFLLTSLTRNQALYTFATSYSDTAADSALDLKTSPPSQSYPPPTNLAYVESNSGKLYGWTGIDNTLWFSTLNQPEYWPTNALNQVDILQIDSNSGGYIVIGEPGTVITAVVPEGVSPVDQLTSSILIFQNTGMIYALYGATWADYELKPRCVGDCLNAKCAINNSGLIVWIAKTGPMAMLRGSSNPMPIYQKLFPPHSDPFTSARDTTKDAKIVAETWGHWFIFAYTSAGSVTVNDKAWMLYIPALEAGNVGWWPLGTASVPLNAQSFLVLDSVQDNGSLIYANSVSGDISYMMTKTSTNSYWSGTTGVAWSYEEMMIATEGKPDRSVGNKTMVEVALLCRRPAADQTITLTAYVNGADANNSGQSAITTNLTLSAAATDPLTWLVWSFTGAYGNSFILRYSGTATESIFIEDRRIRYREAGNAS